MRPPLRYCNHIIQCFFSCWSVRVSSPFTARLYTPSQHFTAPTMFNLTLFFWLLQWVAAYARKGEDLPLSSLLVLHQQHLWFFGLLIMAFIFASSFDTHYYCVWDNAVELVTAAEEALQNLPKVTGWTSLGVSAARPFPLSIDMVSNVNDLIGMCSTYSKGQIVYHHHLIVKINIW